MIFVTLLAVSVSSAAYAKGFGKGAGTGAASGTATHESTSVSGGYQGGANADFERPDYAEPTFDGTGTGFGDGTEIAPQDGTGFGNAAHSGIITN